MVSYDDGSNKRRNTPHMHLFQFQDSCLGIRLGEDLVNYKLKIWVTSCHLWTTCMRIPTYYEDMGKKISSIDLTNLDMIRPSRYWGSFDYFWTSLNKDNAHIKLFNTYCLFSGPSKYDSWMLGKLNLLLMFSNIWLFYYEGH